MVIEGLPTFDKFTTSERFVLYESVIVVLVVEMFDEVLSPPKRFKSPIGQNGSD